MSLNRINIKSLTILISLILLVRVNVYSTVYQTIADGNWNSSSIWTPSKPTMSWGFTDTIYINNQINLNKNLNIYGFFVVQSGAMLSNDNKSITVKGDATFTNNGTVEIKSLKMDWGLTSGINNGTLTLDGSFTNREGSFVNNNLMTIDNNFNNSWDGDFTNNGNINIGGYFKNSDIYSGNGDLSVDGNFTNDWSSDYSTTGTITVQGNFINRGTATLGDKVIVGGKLTNDWSSSLTITDTVLVDGNIDNRGPFINNGYLSGDDFINQDSYTASGDTKVNGSAINKGNISNSGTFNVDGDYQNKWGGNTLTNTGSFGVVGDFTNNGDVGNNGLIYIQGDLNNNSQINTGGNTFVDGTVTGSGDITGSGTLCNSDGTTDPTGGAKANNVSCTVCNGDNVTTPVKLVSFEVKLDLDSKEASIEWATASEENNDYFEVLKSTDGVNYKVIAHISGNGNSNVLINYHAKDYQVAVGVNYYQLKQVDFDGKTTLSEVVAINNIKVNEINVYPNPVNYGQQLQLEFGAETDYQIEVYDMSGRMLKNIEGKGNQLRINTTDLQRGSYMLRVVEGGRSIVKRFLVN